MFKLVVFSFILLPFKLLASNTLNIASDIWCPYVCDKKDSPGILIEVINLIAKEEQIKISFTVLPLIRSLKHIEVKELDAVLALTPMHIDKFNLKPSQQYFGGWQNDFYVHNSSNWKFTSIDDLKLHLGQGNTLGLIKGYEYGKEIDNLKHSPNSKVYLATGSSPLSTALHMLDKQRIAVLVDSRFNVEYEIKKEKLFNLKYVGSEGDFIPLYIGYHRSVDKETIKKIDLGLMKMRKSGQLRSILDKYGAPDWLPR
ncbi:substrate-binding periplasmic protein [Colwelliaceae bacterium 6471]